MAGKTPSDPSDGADPGGGGADKAQPKIDGAAQPKGGEQTRSGHDDGAISEKDAALRSLQGDDSERQDATRASEIAAETIRRLRESAAGTVNYFAADVHVGRDFTSGGSGRPRPSATSGPLPLTPGHLADYTRAYVEPAGFGDGLTILRQRNLLIIAGPDGSGRYTAALTLLTRLVTAPDEESDLPIFSINVGVLADSAWEIPTRRAGYMVVVEPSTVGALERFDDAWLTSTSSALKEAESFLVVVAGQLRGSLTEATRRHDFVVEHLAAPDSMEVLRARVLAGRIDLDHDELDHQLRAAGAEKILTARPGPRLAVRVADAVLEAMESGEDLAAVLERVHNPVEHVREWFDQHAGADQVALAVATAVLDGSSYLTVSDATVELYRLLVPRTAVPPDLQLTALLPIQPWLKRVAANPESLTAPPVVRFCDPDMATAVLKYAWNRLDGMRPTLLKWLTGLVAHPDVEVRARAATMAGVLAADDFQHAVQRYLRPWAVHTSPQLRGGAALALSVVATFERHTAKVWSILREFAGAAQSGRLPHAPATAAIAAGGPLGSDDPEQALRLLRMVSKDGDWHLLESVVIGVLQLVQNGRAAHVVRALMDWTEPADEDNPVAVKGLVAYLVAVREPGPSDNQDGTDADSDPSRDPSREWPVLLSEARFYRNELPELWGRALNRKTVRSLALDALRQWLRIVDQDESAYRPVLDVLAGVADRSQRDMDRLEYYLERWERDEDDPSPAAGRVLNALIAAG
jgi:hypothetical protein